MKITYYLVSIILFFLTLAGCQKGINSPAISYNNKALDSTLTDTTQFLDITLNGERIFQKAYEPGTSDSNWTWVSVLSFWDLTYPDSLYYPFSSLKGGLISLHTQDATGFYFLKNGYGLDINLYTSSKAWWTPLIERSFIDSFFAAGNYNFAASTYRDTTFIVYDKPVTKTLLGTGVNLIWVDDNGKSWQTAAGTADQTNSFFTITDNVSVPFTFQPGFENYAQSTTVTAKFACNLYDNAGNVLHITNGRFRFGFTFKQY